MKYKAILSLELRHSTALLCSIANISRSAYYKYKNKPCKKSSIDDIIIDVFNKTNKRAGYRTVKMIIKNQYQLTVNHKKVQRIMRENDLRSIVRPKRKVYTEPRETRSNVLNRDFSTTKPNQKYATDITYIPTKSSMVYLSTIIDLYDNYPVAWHISDSIDKQISIDTIKILAKKYTLKDCIIHSDQGIHYTNKEYISLLKDMDVVQSMSRKGNCWDNAPAESFFSQYKCECIYPARSKLKNQSDVYEITKEYFDYYINFRPQKRLSGMTPKMYRNLYENSQKK